MVPPLVCFGHFEVRQRIVGVPTMKIALGKEELLYLPQHAEDGLFEVPTCASKIYGALRVERW